MPAAAMAVGAGVVEGAELAVAGTTLAATTAAGAYFSAASSRPLIVARESEDGGGVVSGAGARVFSSQDGGGWWCGEWGLEEREGVFYPDLGEKRTVLEGMGGDRDEGAEIETRRRAQGLFPVLSVWTRGGLTSWPRARPHTCQLVLFFGIFVISGFFCVKLAQKMTGRDTTCKQC